jgi:hypothetical protein
MVEGEEEGTRRGLASLQSGKPVKFNLPQRPFSRIAPVTII